MQDFNLESLNLSRYGAPHDSRYLIAKLLKKQIELLISCRTPIRFNTQLLHNVPMDDPPPKLARVKKDLKKFSKRYHEVHQGLLKSAKLVQQHFTTSTANRLNQFIAWHIHQMEKPVLEQVNNRMYARWRKTIYYTLLNEVPFSQLSVLDGLRVIFYHRFRIGWGRTSES